MFFVHVLGCNVMPLWKKRNKGRGKKGRKKERKGKEEY